MPDRDLEFFHRVATRYDRHWIQWFARAIHARVLRAVDAPSAVLDIGCGTGALLGAIGARWPHARLAGVDAAPGMVEVARRRLPAADIRHGVAEALPWADASFDLAVTSLSFHHWRDQAAGVREAARALRPNGAFLLADISGDGPVGWAVESMRRLARHREEEFAPSARVTAMMAAAGLAEGRVEHFGLYRLIRGRRMP
jgi:ubiquinone/menaquinone biosynthesis C-methylase UbiE